MNECVFCEIASCRVSAAEVFADHQIVIFLDHRPLFPGHCLIIPRLHMETLVETPPELLCRITSLARLLSTAMEKALGAQGTFVALNNKVSQSVPHLHLHVVPRSKGDGLKGFFWPRKKYRDPERMEQLRQALAIALREQLKEER